MEIIATARLMVVLFITASILVTFLFISRLFGAGLAVFMFLLIAFDPFFVAHSRVLHTNGLLATFMFLSLIAFIYYLRTQAISGLVLSGIAAGLSFICISPGVALIPAIGLITLGNLWDGEARRFDQNLKSLMRRVVIPLIAWGAIALLVVFLVWPAMWNNPVGTLVRMLQYGMSAAEGEIGGAHFVGAYQDTGDASNYLNFYPLTYLWRTTPIVLVGLGLAVLVLIFRARSSGRSEGACTTWLRSSWFTL
jgi:4-amino-4-deoxy-L-arabinose transferase-like glycosyltransferase